MTMDPTSGREGYQEPPAGIGRGAAPEDLTEDADQFVAPGAPERMLMAIDGVMGVAVGRTPIGDDAIVVYLRDPSVTQRIPAHVEGFPVETVVTGEIDAYNVKR
jgi:hypothetical protein